MFFKQIGSVFNDAENEVIYGAKSVGSEIKGDIAGASNFFVGTLGSSYKVVSSDVGSGFQGGANFIETIVGDVTSIPKEAIKETGSTYRAISSDVAGTVSHVSSDVGNTASNIGKDVEGIGESFSLPITIGAVFVALYFINNINKQN
jgi:expansin (peptidoglycan-binding protein)